MKLASQYYTGDGVKKDKKKAFEYYMKAAQLGSDEGAAEVGACYLMVMGLSKTILKHLYGFLGQKMVGMELITWLNAI